MRHSLRIQHAVPSGRSRLRRRASILACVLLVFLVPFRPAAAAGDPPPEAVPPQVESTGTPEPPAAPVPAAPAAPAPSASAVAPEPPAAATPPRPAPAPLPEAVRRPVGPLPLELEYLSDPEGRLRPEDPATPARQKAFTLFRPGELPRTAGVFWFRFRPDSTPGVSGDRWVLDLNSRAPGMLPAGSEVFLAPAGTSVPVPAEVVFPGIRLLPETVLDGTVYIRSAGSPGLAFAPVLRERTDLTFADGDATIWMRGLTALCLLLTVIRAFAERREWRMWGGLFTGAVLVGMIWGLPGVESGLIRLVDLPGLLAPGVALFILPHVARRLMRTGVRLPVADMLLILTGVIGLAFCLVPLIPGYAWTVRFLPLWPAFMLLPVPVLLYAAFRNIPGARRVLCVCLLPPLGSAVVVPEIHARIASFLPAGSAASLPGLLPGMGLCLAGVLLAVLPSPGRREGRANTRRTRPSLPEPVPAAPVDLPEPDFDPSRIVVPSPTGSGTPAEAASGVRLDLLEGRLRGPLDALLNELGMLDRFTFPAEARRHLENLSGAGRRLARLIGDLPAQAQPEAPGAAPESTAFDLHQALLTVHDAVLDRAEARNISLSWYAAPHLARWYEGDRDALIRTLSLLAESAVRATERGTVRLSVQRVPESNDPGLLRFSVSDTGTGTPPLRRNPLALIRAWETAASEGGSVTLHSGPSGTEATFSVRLQVLQNDGLSSAPPPAVPPRRRETGFNALRILVVSDVPMTRQMLAHYLDELPHEVHEARSAAEALAMYAASPGALLVFDVDLGVDDIADGVAGIRAVEGERDYPLASILVLADTEEQGEILRRAGCTHVLYKPFSRTGLRRLALRLAPLPRRRGAPAPARPAVSDTDRGEVPSGAPMRLDMPGTVSAPASSATAPARTNGIGKSDAARSAPKRGFSNVGEPMPIPKTARTNDRDTEPPASKQDRVERPVPVRLVPAPGTARAPVEAVEWVGDPVPVAGPALTAPADSAVAADPAAPDACRHATAVSPHAVAADTPPDADPPARPARPDKTAPGTPQDAVSPAVEMPDFPEVREEPEVRVIRRPLRTPGAGVRKPDSAREAAEPAARKPGLLRSLFTAVGLSRRRPDGTPDVPPVVDDPSHGEWVGDPMPVAKTAPTVPALPALATPSGVSSPGSGDSIGRSEDAAPGSEVPPEPEPQSALPFSGGHAPTEGDETAPDKAPVGTDAANSGESAAAAPPSGSGPEQDTAQSAAAAALPPESDMQAHPEPLHEQPAGSEPVPTPAKADPQAPATLPEPLLPMPGVRSVNRPLPLLDMMVPEEEEDDGEAADGNGPAPEVPEAPAAAEDRSADPAPLPDGTAERESPAREAVQPTDPCTEAADGPATHVSEGGKPENEEEARYAALPDRLRRAYEAAQQGYGIKDLEAVRTAAAELADLARNAGLRELAEPAVYLEEAARDNDTDAVHGLLSDIRKAVERNTAPF